MIYIDDFLITEVVYKNKKTKVYIKLDNYEFDGQITTINIVEDKCTVITSGAPKNFS